MKLAYRTYPARLMRMRDGDSYTLTLDLGVDTFVNWKTRLRGVDTPEKKHPLYLNARAAAEHAMSTVPADAGAFPLVVRTFQTRDGSDEREKYGRLLVDILTPLQGDLATWLVDIGLAKYWDGHGEHPWVHEPLI